MTELTGECVERVAREDIEWIRSNAEMFRQQSLSAVRPLPELQTNAREMHALAADRWERIAAAITAMQPAEATINIPPDEKYDVIARIADAVCLDVCELPDRSPPEDWPEACLVTSDELHDLVSERVAEALADYLPASAAMQPAIDAAVLAESALRPFAEAGRKLGTGTSTWIAREYRDGYVTAEDFHNAMVAYDAIRQPASPPPTDNPKE